MESMQIVSAYIARHWDEETVKSSDDLYNAMRQVAAEAEDRGLTDIHEWDGSAEAHRLALMAFTITTAKAAEWNIPDPTDANIIEAMTRVDIILNIIGA